MTASWPREVFRVVRWAAYVLFYGYAGLLVVAGAWGVLFAHVDQWWLLGLDLNLVGDETVQSNVLTQYRFLRAVELGFGLAAFRYRHEIFRAEGFYGLFLSVMVLGVVARAISLVLDGTPDARFLVFMALEAAGAITIYLTATDSRRAVATRDVRAAAHV